MQLVNVKAIKTFIFGMATGIASYAITENAVHIVYLIKKKKKS